MSDILDLDTLLPEPKKIKIKGKIIECYPPTIKQLLNLEKAVKKIRSKDVTEDEGVSILEDALSSLIPALKDDKELDLTFTQFYALIQFLQKESLPQSATKAAAYPVEKKTASQEE